MLRFFAVLLFVLGLPLAHAHAQFSATDPLSVTIAPDYPRPYETVTITPRSTLIDLSSAVVTVALNGKVVMTGTGVQGVPINVAGPGLKTVVTVTATTGGKTYRKEITIRPADVSLVVEPITTTHPFYQGAAQTAPEGRVRVIALADLRSTQGTRINPASLSYTWRFGNQILESDSGIGRTVLTAAAPMRYRDAQLTVTVTSPDNSIVAQAATVINPTDPIIRIYKTDPLLGPDFDHALTGSYTMSSAEESFRGVAYFFGATPTLNWSVNGQGSGGDKDVTVRTTGTTAGTANVALTARNDSVHQSVTNTLRVTFGSSGTNLFGF